MKFYNLLLAYLSLKIQALNDAESARRYPVKRMPTVVVDTRGNACFINVDEILCIEQQTRASEGEDGELQQIAVRIVFSGHAINAMMATEEIIDLAGRMK